MTKPFGMDELLARLRAALRRAAPPDEEAVVIDRRLHDRPRGEARHDATARRSGSRRPSGSIVEVLVRNAGKLVAQKQLLQEVWGPEYETETNYLRVFMAHIRRKLEPEPAARGTSSPSRAWATASRDRAPSRYSSIASCRRSVASSASAR